jgi:hypothetical protein
MVFGPLATPDNVSLLFFRREGQPQRVNAERKQRADEVQAWDVCSASVILQAGFPIIQEYGHQSDIDMVVYVCTSLVTGDIFMMKRSRRPEGAIKAHSRYRTE